MALNMIKMRGETLVTMSETPIFNAIKVLILRVSQVIITREEIAMALPCYCFMYNP